MTMDGLNRSSEEYRLQQKKAEELGKLATLLDLAESAGVHREINLPERIRLRNLKEAANHRAAIINALSRRLSEGVDESGEVSKNRQLISQIIEGITRLNDIDEALSALDDGDDEPNGDNGNKAGVSAA